MKSVVELPFNRLLDLQSAENDSSELLALPAGAQYLNHLGTVHASALLALAEASSGEWLLRKVGNSEGIIPVVRRLEARFRKPARGRVTSQAKVTDGAWDLLQTQLKEKARALITIQVELHDESDAHVLSAEVEWFATKLSTA